MARIPTLSASSIAPLPGSAGGVRLGRTGVGSIPIETPLTPRLNPSQYGQESAAIAQLGEKIFLEGVLPGIEISRKNARAKATLQASNNIYDEVNAIKGELLQNELSPGWEYSTKEGIFDEEVAWSKRFNNIYTRIDKIIPGISTNIKDKKHAIAVTNAFLPQVMALKVKAQNRQKELSGDRAAYAYKQNQQNHITDLTALLQNIKITKNKKGEKVYSFPGTKIDELMQRIELTDTVFANSGLAPLKRFDIIENARKQKIEELANTLQTEPEMGKEFLARYGEQLGMTPGEIGDMINKMDKFAVQDLKLQNFMDEEEAARQEMEAQATLNANTKLGDGTTVSYRTSLMIKAHSGELTIRDLFNQRDLFDRAGDITTYNDIQAMVEQYDLAAGETDPKVYDDFLDEIALLLGQSSVTPDEIKAIEQRINNETKKLSKGDRIKLLGEINLKNHNSLNDPNYKRGSAFLMKQAPVPTDKYDTSSAAQRSRAIWRIWHEDINRLIKKNDRAAWRNFDFFGRAKEIVDAHSDLWGDVSGAGSQSLLKEQEIQFNAVLGTDLDFMVKRDPGDKLSYPDVDAMREALHNNPGLTTDQIRRANELIDVLGKFPGLSKKVAQIREYHKTLADQEEAARLAAEQAERDSQDLYKMLTPDIVEEWIKENNPELYKKYYGADANITLTTPAPDEEPPTDKEEFHPDIELPTGSDTSIEERKQLQKEEKDYYENNPQSTLELTPTPWKTPYGMPVFTDQHGQRHSESSETMQFSNGKWGAPPMIWPDPKTGRSRYFKPKEVKALIEANNYINPVSGERVQLFDTEPEATEHAIDRDLILRDPKHPWNQPGSVKGQERTPLYEGKADYSGPVSGVAPRSPSDLIPTAPEVNVYPYENLTPPTGTSLDSDPWLLLAEQEEAQAKIDRGESFDPEGPGYDMSLALAAGMEPELDLETGEMHWGTRLPITRAETKKALGFKPSDDVGLVLKGRQHITWDKAKKVDEALGYKYIKRGHRWYSVKPGVKKMPPKKTKRPKEKKISKKPLFTNMPLMTLTEIQRMGFNGSYVHSDVDIQNMINMLSSEEANLSQPQKDFLKRLRDAQSLRAQDQSPKN